MTPVFLKAMLETGWHLVITFTATLAAITIPLQLVFNQTGSEIYSWEILVTLLFGADLVYQQVSLRHAQEEAFPHLRTVPAKSRGFWLAVDLLSALPLGFTGLSPFWSGLRCLKLLRVAQTMHQWRQRILKFSDLLKLAFFAFWLLLISHWLACGWLALIADRATGDPLTRYLSALHWVIETLTSVGFGEIVPVTNGQRLYSIVIMLTGVGVYGYVIGSMAGILAKRDPAKNQYFNNLDQLSAFVQYRDIPPALQKRIRDYFAYIWKKRLGFDETHFLSGLPRGLASEISLHLKREILDRIPLFKDVESDFIEEVALNLKPDVYTPGEYVFKEGRPARRMYLVIKGVLEVVRKDGTVINVLKEGNFFGEIALFTDQPRTASVRAVTYCDLYILEKDVFLYLLEQFPDIGAHMKEIARRRLERDENQAPVPGGGLHS
ncbi:MAG: cyclic nucleotide-binding domain-containing protein [Deltaproteobacteria bacterium]|nr:cyclic nucleotide-binding domain-containing protein [Deltaproteobacteria bacterium]